MKVLNVYDMEDAGVYIGRNSKWGNPFIIGVDGNRQQVIEKYKLYLDEHPELKEAAKIELKGKNLACFCAPKSCHGDVLLLLANPELLNNPLTQYQESQE